MEKKCTKCKAAKDSSEFALKNSETGRRSSVCKTCHAKYLRAHYRKHPERYKQNSRKQRKKLLEANFQKLLEYLSEHHCVDCGENDPVCLTFDHIRGKKTGDIGNMWRSHSWEVVFEEIEKCEVRCVNCHMKRTARQRDWKKSRLPHSSIGGAPGSEPGGSRIVTCRKSQRICLPAGCIRG